MFFNRYLFFEDGFEDGRAFLGFRVVVLFKFFLEEGTCNVDVGVGEDVGVCLRGSFLFRGKVVLLVW